MNEGSLLHADPGRDHRSGHRHRHRLRRPLGRRQRPSTLRFDRRARTHTFPDGPRQPCVTVDQVDDSDGASDTRHAQLGDSQQRRARRSRALLSPADNVGDRRHDAHVRLGRLDRPRSRHDHVHDPGRTSATCDFTGTNEVNESERRRARFDCSFADGSTDYRWSRAGDRLRRRRQRLECDPRRHDRHGRSDRRSRWPRVTQRSDANSSLINLHVHVQQVNVTGFDGRRRRSFCLAAPRARIDCGTVRHGRGPATVRCCLHRH